jgi:hypothetical protein
MIDIPSPSCLATEFSCDSGASWATTIEELATAAATNRILVKDFMVILLVFLVFWEYNVNLVTSTSYCY